MADVAADILVLSVWGKKTRNHRESGVSYDGEVTTDGTGGGSQGVGGTEEDTAGLDGVLTLPDHSADGAAQHV